MRCLALSLFVLLAFGCQDPVHEDSLDSLGEEDPAVPPGPLHRPGEPCVLCHDGSATESTPFEFAGTVYQFEGLDTPVVGAKVVFNDSKGRRYETATNCAGNFFIVQWDFDPTWPVFVKLEYAGLPEPVYMQSPLYLNEDSTLSGLRDRSCAHCHADPKSELSVGPVYLLPQEAIDVVSFPPTGCPPP